MTQYHFLTELKRGEGDEQTSGILVVYKPSGVTSHDVVNWARRMTGVKRIGHAGTLDPLAKGVLILLIGREYTKRQSEFLKQDKWYRCIFELGYSTDTYDSDGEVLHRDPWDKVKNIKLKEVEKICKSFEGEYDQVVPPFAAVKVGGRKLYELAREGQLGKRDLPSRKVKIPKIDLISFSKNNSEKSARATIDVWCSSGTYIRSLAHDIGKKLGVGATVVSLTRMASGDISYKDAVLCPIIPPRRNLTRSLKILHRPRRIG